MHIPQGACAEVIWLTGVWHKRCETSNLYYISWHFLDWQPWTDWFLEKFISSRYLLLLWLVLYTEYSFLQTLRLRQGGCSFAFFFFSFNKHTLLLRWSASLLGLQAREWPMSNAAILLPTSHCHGTGSSADRTPVQWSYRVQTFCAGLTEMTHFDFYCLECFELSIRMISLTFGLSSSAYIQNPIHISFVDMIFLLYFWYNILCVG